MTTEALPKVVVVLGAGASHDAWNGEVPRDTRFRPPLANQLFRHDGQEEFWPVLERHPGALVLQQQLGPQSAIGTLELEKQLLAYARHDDAKMRRHFKDVPLYIRDVIRLVSRKYLKTLGTGTYTQLVMGLVADHPHDVLFLSLNYDDFLEQALARFDATLSIQKVEDYVRPGLPQIVKVHGSINWVRSMGTISSGVWDIAFEKYDPEGGPSEIVLQDVGENSRGAMFTRTDGAKLWAYPAITAPLAEKSGFVCPPEHTAALSTFVQECRNLFIGTSGLDEDVLSFLAENMPEKAFAGHVGLGSTARTVARAIEESCPALSGDVFRHPVSDDGFASYVRGDDFGEFLAGPPDVGYDEVLRPKFGGSPLTNDYI